MHLYKSLLKSKPISTSSAFPAYIAAKVSQPSEHPDTATANVTARLFNSNPVKAALAAILGNVHRELGITLDELPLKKKRLRAADYGHNPQPVVEGQNPAPDAVTNGLPRDQVAREKDCHVRSPRRSISTADDDASNSEGESTDYEQYQSRLANSDSEDEAQSLESNSWEGIDAISTPEPPDSPVPPITMEAAPPQYHPSPSPSLSLSPSPSLPHSTHPPKPPKPAPTTTQTTFLPALTSGYFSGTDSDPPLSDTEPSAAAPRKNRRGQQERRAIWEKKFGLGAKHLQGQERVQSRDEGWDARRGASDARGRGRGRERGGGGMRGRERGSRGQLASGANGEVVSGKRSAGRGGAKRKEDEGPLHPSWEAKKKAKEKAAAGGGVAFLGKKIVFE